MESSATLSWLGEEWNRIKASNLSEFAGTVAQVGPRKPAELESVHHQARRRRNSGCVNMPEGEDQPGDRLQLEEEVCWPFTELDEALEAV